MAINISVQYNSGLLPDILLLTQGNYHRRTRLNTMYWLCLHSLCNSIILLLPCLMMYYHVFVFAVFLVSLHDDYNVVSVPHNGGLLPDIVLLTQCYYHGGTCLNAMKRFCICSL